MDENGELVYRRFVIRVPFAQLRDLARSVGSRISPLVMALQSHAVAKTWNTSGKALVKEMRNRGLDAQMEDQGTHAAPQYTIDAVLRLD